MIEPGDLFAVDAPAWKGHQLECIGIFNHAICPVEYSGCINCVNEHHWIISAEEGAWCERWCTLFRKGPPKRNREEEIDEVRSTADAAHRKVEKLEDEVRSLRDEIENLRNELTG